MTLQAAALVLLSDGQDSSTCLAWALQRYERVETVAFDYGQRHRVELTQRLVVRDALRELRREWNARLFETICWTCRCWLPSAARP